MDQICGYIEKIIFHNQDSGFGVAMLREPKRSEPTCIVGNFATLQPGETVRCTGTWKHHLVYGRQFEVKECTSEAPADVEGIKKYLGSGLIKGIGPMYAKRIVEKFGADTLNVIDEQPQRLLEVEGLGRKRQEKIVSCWSEQKSIRQVMVFLQSHGVSPAYAQKVFKVYGDKSIQQVKTNPYSLARDIHGIGFKTADVIAQKLGMTKTDPHRIDAGIEFVLESFSDDGHACYPRAEFLLAAHPILEVDMALIEGRIEFLKDDDSLEVFDLIIQGESIPFLWLKQLFRCETGIAREIKRLKSAECPLRNIDTARAIDWAQKVLSMQLAPQQHQAVCTAHTEKIEIITGGPGTGKSTITKAILAISEQLTDKIVLAAPTGRAAKRMSEITGKPASTIHSLLEISPKGGGFKRNRDNPLDADLVIIDEASMIDTFLMYGLLKAIPDRCRVILVGDINQLPSVGPGNVLRDLIGSFKIPVVQLTEIFRQAAGSSIVTNAHRINQGHVPDLTMRSDGDFFFIEANEPEEVLSTIISLVSQRLPRKYGLNAIKDIQVLAPMRRGVIGTENLNVQLQQILNPQTEEAVLRFGRKFMQGDKVMQIRNNYKKEIFNGDVGSIAEIDHVDQFMRVQFDERSITYEFSELDELVLAYAVSVHKYQGSECPCVVMPVHTTHFKLLHRNLLYTGVTRGKRLVVLVGNKKALFIAVKTDDVKKRYTGLLQAVVGTL